ncbi:hypothetical protein N7462_009939 [Penicillium macrosclerotiorum]|uniref:uncharacterized protein n=1 Tax=Penicillium macrosclerotiorum TaxID=303699 RepID=UPI002547EFB8|nr:uncharacterized protein N7462_009939 [Penicillium macrosclerotiorum]KAJ5668869.1 hypothetical protein N7462_009939 [Penicillium macrosclerotiorum]
MPPPPPPAPPRPPLKQTPQNHQIFDPWNSASTGHQRAENPYSNTTAWRDTRAHKLARQLRGGDCNEDSEDGVRTAQAFDGTCGLVSPTRDEGRVVKGGEWRWVSEEEAKRARLGVRDIRCFMGVGKRRAGGDLEGQTGKKAKSTGDRLERASAFKSGIAASLTSAVSSSASSSSEPDAKAMAPNTVQEKSKPDSQSAAASVSTLFAGTTIYVNGSTLPQISDHKLKQLLVSHGAKVSIAMARRSVSHVVIGQPSGIGQGAGGGLAARKLQQEIERGGWKGVKVVGVDWVLESIKAGKRLAESRFAAMHVAPKGQRSVAGMFGGR